MRKIPRKDKGEGVRVNEREIRQYITVPSMYLQLKQNQCK
jgi:hypothetical protein